MSERTIRIGNAGGYWGDDLAALGRQLRGGPIDYVTIDFLAEITMSIMQKQKERDPSAGYARDFVEQLAGVLPELVTRGTRVITNAGGVNPKACAEAILKMARDQGLPLKIAIVEGDDLLPRLDEILDAGAKMEDMETGAPFSDIRKQVTSANAYFGAGPIVEALRGGAQVIVTGRTTDTGITLAPMIHEFEWDPTDWNKLGMGIVAGHIIECGTQATGGNYTDWEKVPTFENIGYPIVEVEADGSFTVTKHAGTGGLVSVPTVREQLVYEMGDPRHYFTPDVISDFTAVQLTQAGPDRVRVTGGKGGPPTDTLKVSVSYKAGWKCTGTIILCGPKARQKAEKFAEVFWKRYGTTTEDRLTEYVGHDSCHRSMTPAHEPHEILLRLGVRDSDQGKVEAFSKLIPSLILSGPPGVAVTGGRPPVQQVMAYWPALVPRRLLVPEVTLIDEKGRRGFQIPWKGPTSLPSDIEETLGGIGRKVQKGDGPRKMVTAPLSAICHGRSGDKGDTANIGLIARHPDLYPVLVENVTAAKVKEFFGEVCQGVVFRYEVPNLQAINLLLSNTLGGGGTLALQIDAQGKTLSHALMRMEIEIDEELLAKARGEDAK